MWAAMFGGLSAWAEAVRALAVALEAAAGVVATA